MDGQTNIKMEKVTRASKIVVGKEMAVDIGVYFLY